MSNRPDWNEYVRRHLSLPELTREREDQIREDLALQFEQAYTDARARGLSETDAETAARAHVPDWDSFTSDVYRSERRHAKSRLDHWNDRATVTESTGGIMSRWLSDLRLDAFHGLRTLRKSPGFAATAILTLALGIGANTAIYSVVDAVLLRPLPYRDSDRIVAAFEHDLKSGSKRSPISPFIFRYWSEHAESLEVTTAATPWHPVLTGRERPEQMRGLRASASLFRLLGVPPHLGRAFGEEDGRYDSEPIVVLGYALWQRRFGGDEDIIGEKLELDGRSYAVVGVMPPGFRFPPFWATGAEFWTPLVFSAAEAESHSRYLRFFARLRSGVAVSEARAELSTLAERLAATNPQVYANLAVTLEPVHESTVNHARPALLVLMGAVIMVLLIACANVAGLLLVRGSARRREMAVRMALGADRRRLGRLLVTESLILAVPGGLAGWVLAGGALSALLRLAADGLPRAEEVALDARVLLFTVGLSLLTALLAGLAPAWQISRFHLNESLQDGGRQPGLSRNRLRHVFVVFQVALAIVLLTGAGLLLRTLHRLQTFDTGFDRSSVLTAVVSFAASPYAPAERQSLLFEELTSRLSALPGVESAGLVNHLPFGGDIWGQRFTIEHDPVPAPEDNPTAVFRVATPGYFRAMDIRLLRGRDFAEEDSADSAPVVIVNETFARRYLSGREPLGHRIRLGGADSTGVWRTVVGIIADTRQWDLTDDPPAEFHLPYTQNPAPWWKSTSIAVRSTQQVTALARSVEAEVHAVDPNLPVSSVRTMEEILESEVLPQRLTGVLAGSFAAMALLLTAVGVYGVMASTVGQRTREIGVRMAFGAQPGAILRLFVGRGLSLLLRGTVLGLLVALAFARFLESLLFGIPTRDPLTFVGVTVLLAVVALLACYVPARRATKVDPMVALRYE